MTRFVSLARHFLRQRAGTGTVEFMLIVPVLLILYIGEVDVTRAIVFSQKMQNATVVVNDLVTQATELSKADVIESFGAADAILSSYGVQDLNMRVTAVEIDATGTARVAWSVVRGMGAVKSGDVYSVPARLKGLRSFTLVVTESSYAFSPISEYVIRTKIPMSAESFGRFRGRKAVACADCAT